LEEYNEVLFKQVEKLAIIAEMENKPEEQRELNERAVVIWRAEGLPIAQWYTDNGY
jgi:hypothetical protein